MAENLLRQEESELHQNVHHDEVYNKYLFHFKFAVSLGEQCLEQNGFPQL